MSCIHSMIAELCSLCYSENVADDINDEDQSPLLNRRDNEEHPGMGIINRYGKRSGKKVATTNPIFGENNDHAASADVPKATVPKASGSSTKVTSPIASLPAPENLASADVPAATVPTASGSSTKVTSPIAPPPAPENLASADVPAATVPTASGSSTKVTSPIASPPASWNSDSASNDGEFIRPHEFFDSQALPPNRQSNADPDVEFAEFFARRPLTPIAGPKRVPLKEIPSHVTNSRLGASSSRRDADNGEEGNTSGVGDENAAVNPDPEDDEGEDDETSETEPSDTDQNDLRDPNDDDEDDDTNTLARQFENTTLSDTAFGHQEPSTGSRNGEAPHGQNSSSEVNEDTSYITNFYLDSGVEAMRKIYEADLEKKMEVTTWDELIPVGTIIEKIAEASFAEVFRITTPQDTSIMKVMRIQIDTDSKTADMYTAIDPHAILSEIRIMNALTVLPGFVTFKGARLVHGICSLPLKDACDQYMTKHGILEEDIVHAPPSEYMAESLFLIIELGDAGDVLENLSITTVDQLWDVLIGTVMALTAGEEIFEFEHRDLHENNICYKKTDISQDELESLPIDVKYGRSGITLTLIDFGLSRAKLETGAREVIYNDLDGDMTLFRSQHDKGNNIQKLQYETYRRMRTYLMEGKRVHKPSKHHETRQPLPVAGEPDGLHRWDEYIPYSNVLWVRYLLEWARHKLEKHLGKLYIDVHEFNATIKEFEQRLRPSTAPDKGAFVDAKGILTYMIDQGWVTQGQFNRMLGIDVE